MEWDAAQAAEKGTSLTWNSTVRDIVGGGGSLSCKTSVFRHLRLMRDTQCKGFHYQWKVISVIWDLIVSPSILPEARESFFKWLGTNFAFLDKEARVKLSGSFSLCRDALIVSTELVWKTNMKVMPLTHQNLRTIN